MSSPASAPPVSRRTVLRLVGGTLAVAVSSRSLQSAKAETTDSAARSDVAGSDHAVVDERRYRGTVTTTLTTTTGDSQSVADAVEVTVSPPATRDAHAANPFELTIAGPTDGAVTAAPGRVVTSEVSFDSEGRRHVERHWNVQAGEDGVFSGVLRDSNAETNVLTSRRALIPGHENTMVLVTEAMAGGATLAGTITPEGIDIDVSGTTTNRFAGATLDRTRPFACEIRATRVRDD
jgi:hypothetical protein